MKMDYLKLVGASFVTAGALATAAAYYLTRPEPVPRIIDLNDQSSEIPGKDRAHISKFCKDGKLVSYIAEDARTLYESMKRGARLSNNGPCLGWKPSPSEPFKWLSYNEVLQKAANFGAGLIKLGLKPLNSTNVGIYSQNRPEYVILEQGAFAYSMVAVPLYDTLGEQACNFIINQAEITIVVCDTNKKVNNLLNRHKETPGLKTVVIMEAPNGEVTNTAKNLGVTIIKFSEVENLGKENPCKLNPPKPDDLSIICYTSGTTGLPKGALLTHQGAIAVASSCTVQLEPAGLKIHPDDVMISYLPLAHSYETLLETCCYLHGASVGFFQGDVKKLMDDIKELKPTVFPTVPRLLNRFYDKVMAGINSSAVKKFLFNIALREKEKEIQRGIIRKNSMWDKLIFKKVQEGLGGRCRLIVTGSAPLSPKVLAFLRCCVGCTILEGYGQTECHAIATLQLVGDPSVGNVGPPLASNQIKLIDVPEMNYFAADNKGEVCINGPSVFKGYLKDPQKTHESLDEEGWLHTGDIGEWTSFGCLRIIDRKKHIFKLSQGEYIAPEKIENIYIRSTLVAQMFVYGDSLRSCLIGVAVPDPETLPKFAKDKLNLSLPLKDLVTNPAVKRAILEDLLDIGRKAGLSSLEQVKDVYIYPKLFSVENGLLTPTFKAKRHELKKYFEPQLKDMYSKLS